jgi:hypothetical protein
VAYTEIPQQALALSSLLFGSGQYAGLVIEPYLAGLASKVPADTFTDSTAISVTADAAIAALYQFCDRGFRKRSALMMSKN